MLDRQNLTNDKIQVEVKLHGAELVSLKKVDCSEEYMWCGNVTYWGRVSPILFPFVGKLEKQEYRHNGKIYTQIPQHGFARDSEFEIVDKSKDTIWLRLIKDEKWKEKYPFECELIVGYKLENTIVHVMWKVINTGDKDLHFSIGAHPAFACDDGLGDYSIDFHVDDKEISCGLLNEDGVLSEKSKIVKLQKGILHLSDELFESDALIMNGCNLKKATLLKGDSPILQVEFDTPLLGIWSPANKNAPFVCIEPWYGRCDRQGFKGELSEREYGNTLKSGEIFEKEYMIKLI